MKNIISKVLIVLSYLSGIGFFRKTIKRWKQEDKIGQVFMIRLLKLVIVPMYWIFLFIVLFVGSAIGSAIINPSTTKVVDVYQQPNTKTEVNVDNIEDNKADVKNQENKVEETKPVVEMSNRFEQITIDEETKANDYIANKIDLNNNKETSLLIDKATDNICIIGSWENSDDFITQKTTMDAELDPVTFEEVRYDIKTNNELTSIGLAYASNMAKNVIEENAINPKSCKFPSIVFSRDEWNISIDEDRVATISSWVDAKNAFDGTIRSYFTVEYNFNTKTTTLISIENNIE